MQDRFKFRVWNKENKKLYDWDFLEKTKGEDCTLFWCLNQAQNDFKHNILLQCTGLKDKNGKLIYEGDVVKVCDVSALGYVRERIGKVVYGYSFYPAFVIETTFGDIKDFTEDIEVIGNKFENPELLDEGEACKK